MVVAQANAPLVDAEPVRQDRWELPGWLGDMQDYGRRRLCRGDLYAADSVYLYTSKPPRRLVGDSSDAVWAGLRGRLSVNVAVPWLSWFLEFRPNSLNIAAGKRGLAASR